MTDEVVNPGATEEVVANPGAEVVEKPEVKVDTLVTKVEEQPSQWYQNDWREKMANGDAKELARLQRFPSPSDVYKSYRELEGKVSSGALKQEIDTSKFSDEQLAEYRKANGIPTAPSDYKIDFPEGLVLSDEDEVILGTVLETMHKQNRKESEVKEIVSQFFAARETAAAARYEQDKVAIVEAEETLRREWQGQDYLTNIAAVKNLLASAPNGLGERLAQARLPDGSLLGTDPEALKWLAAQALELNPAGTIVPGVGADQMKSVQTELAELNALMQKDINAWRKNEPARARHRELIDAELKLKQRGY